MILRGNAQVKMVQKDEMNCLMIQDLTSIAEATYISAVHTRIISFVNGKLLISQIQDSVIGGYLLTKDNVSIDSMFTIRMQQNSETNMNMTRFIKNGFQSGKQLLSLVLPQISYSGNSSFVIDGLAKYIKYKPTDKQLNVELGEIKSGYFDKGANDLQKQIALVNDPQTTLNIIFSIQQTILNYNKYCGFSVGFNDIRLTDATKQIIQEKKDMMMFEGQNLIMQYSKNALLNPIEKVRYDYFMERMMEVFFDDGVEAIMNSAGIKENVLSNNLVNMSITGSKGSLGNIKSMIVWIGQALVDNEPLKQLFQGRLNMFYKKYDYDPSSYGIVLDSYLSGLTPKQILTNAIPERAQMLQKVLSVAKPGNLGRKMIKNLEGILITNVRFVEKNNAVTQFLFGYDGFMVQCLGRYKIPHIAKSTQEFKKIMISLLPQDLSKDKELTDIVQQHVDFIADQVLFYKQCMVKNQSVNNQYTFSDSLQIPLVIETTIQTRLEELRSVSQIVESNTRSSNIKQNIKILHKFSADLKYLYFNSNLLRNGTHIPRHYECATHAIRLAILCAFTVDKLSQFSPSAFNLVLRSIALDIQHAMIEPGSTIGVNVAQAYQEFFTQDLLDAIHKTGTGKVLKNPLDRIIEIFNNRTAQYMMGPGKTPPLIRIPLIYSSSSGVSQQQRDRAELIASNIKLIQLKSLVSQWYVLLGNLERETDDSYIKDRDFMKDVNIPQEYTLWCIRIVFDKMKLFLNKISINEIRVALETETNFQVFVINNTEDQDELIMRIYIGNTINFESRAQLQQITDIILDFSVRGLDQILSASVIEEKKTVVLEDGSLQQQSKLCIIAEGSNLRDIYRLQGIYRNDIDFNNITCDNHSLTMQFYGTGACQGKLVNEIRGLFGGSLDIRHCLLVVDEMLQLGRLTSIEHSGLVERCPDNELLSVSDSRAIHSLTKAALQSKTATVNGLSSSSILGSTSRFGCSYNQFVLNESIFQQIEQSSYENLISSIE